MKNLDLTKVIEAKSETDGGGGKSTIRISDSRHQYPLNSARVAVELKNHQL